MPIFDNQSRLIDRFGLLLCVTVASIVILMLVDIGPRVTWASGRWQAALATLLVGSTLLLALRASGLSRRYQRVADIVVIAVLALVVFLAIVATFTDNVPEPTRAAPPLVVLLGAISGYLLLSIAFFYLFLSYSNLETLPFFGEPQKTTAYMYFSLTTITTTGYGDLTAATEGARLLAMAEAVTGQIYLVTYVAMLVGLYISGRRGGLHGGPEQAAEAAEPDPTT